ncbi:MAG: efflux RND transporter periplasmic adaptor subunit [Dongiaceae bacterium]
MVKRTILLLLTAAILAGIGYGFWWFDQFRSKMIAGFINAPRPPTPVTAVEAKAESVPQYLPAIGSLAAVHQVIVTSQVGGEVMKIWFEPGATVKQGDPLVQLDDRPEQADLASFQAQARYAEVQLGRARELAGRQFTSQAQVDQNRSQLDQANAGIVRNKALIDQKLIHAPFGGTLGIRLIEVGEYVNPGKRLVSLTDLDQLYVNFTLPEQDRSRLSVGQAVEISVDAFPNRVFKATLATIEPQVSIETRTIKLQATMDNPGHLLLPGMFANVRVVLPPLPDMVTVPATAVDFTLYGDSVFVIQDSGKDDKGQPVLKAVRTFVRTGERFADRVAVLTGLKPGERVAASGQIKLFNDAPVTLSESQALVPPATAPND